VKLTEIVQQGLNIGMLQHYEEVLGLTSFLSGQKLDNVMEIGTWKSGFFYILCKLASNAGVKITLDLDGYGEVDIGRRNANMATYASNVYIINGDSHAADKFQEVQSCLDGEKLDFLMIDGDHSYDGARLDYFMYGGLVKKGGWIAFHDINDTKKHRESNCFVSRLWNEIKAPKKIEINMEREWGGIGLVQK
jgi:cephalosporin hydroxylase